MTLVCCSITLNNLLPAFLAYFSHTPGRAHFVPPLPPLSLSQNKCSLLWCLSVEQPTSLSAL